ncbi:hypothetical protein MRB53_003909 [Persea americana]|uniref:Uncharacterized protein n=1 Tax=Persea americana TaxID=3435 RepID=A0ACC2MZR5_PERAE|nr:hypothetical protein MRB53_003909 [Persea americana]
MGLNSLTADEVVGGQPLHSPKRSFPFLKTQIASLEELSLKQNRSPTSVVPLQAPSLRQSGSDATISLRIFSHLPLLLHREDPLLLEPLGRIRRHRRREVASSSETGSDKKPGSGAPPHCSHCSPSDLASCCYPPNLPRCFPPLGSLYKTFSLHFFVLHLERSSCPLIKLSRDLAPSPHMKSNHRNKECILVVRPRSLMSVGVHRLSLH